MYVYMHPCTLLVMNNFTKKTVDDSVAKRLTGSQLNLPPGTINRKQNKRA